MDRIPAGWKKVDYDFLRYIKYLRERCGCPVWNWEDIGDYQLHYTPNGKLIGALVYTHPRGDIIKCYLPEDAIY